REAQDAAVGQDEFDGCDLVEVDGQQTGPVRVGGGRVWMELVHPVVEGMSGDSLGLAESNDGGAGVAEALQALGPQLARFGSGTNGSLCGQGHGGNPEDLATPPKIIRLSMT